MSWGSYQNNVSCARGYPIHLLESYFEKPNLIYDPVNVMIRCHVLLECHRDFA